MPVCAVLVHGLGLAMFSIGLGLGTCGLSLGLGLAEQTLVLLKRF